MSLPTVSTSTRIGWIGLGVMGAPMCGHLLRQGHPVTVFTRTPSKAASVLAKGAKWVESPLAVAEASEVVFTMVGSPLDVRQVYLGEAGLLKGARSGSLLVDMTTSASSLAREFIKSTRSRGMHISHVAIVGRDVDAKSHTTCSMNGRIDE